MPAAAKTYTLQREDGSAVTAQEVYDALMAGPVWLMTDDLAYHTIMLFAWWDSSGGHTNPADVGAIVIAVLSEQPISITIGDKSLIPE